MFITSFNRLADDGKAAPQTHLSEVSRQDHEETWLLSYPSDTERVAIVGGAARGVSAAAGWSAYAAL